jgi:hypothetical protein
VPFNAKGNGAARAPRLAADSGKLIPWQFAMTFMPDKDSSQVRQLRHELTRLQQQADVPSTYATWQLPGDLAAASMRAIIDGSFVMQPSQQVQQVAAVA